jgi:hypothetical protein
MDFDFPQPPTIDTIDLKLDGLQYAVNTMKDVNTALIALLIFLGVIAGIMQCVLGYYTIQYIKQVRKKQEVIHSNYLKFDNTEEGEHKNNNNLI